MLTAAHLLPNVSHEFRFAHDNANIRLLDETGENTLLFAGLKYDATSVVLNDCLEGTWGQELRLTHPAPGEDGHAVLWIKFNGTRLEVWTRFFATTFDRFDAARARAVRFMKVYDSRNVRKSLELRVLSPEAMTFEINHQLMQARLTQLEDLVRAQGTKVGTPG